MLSSGTQAHYIFPSPPGCTLILTVQNRASNIMIIVQESGTKKRERERRRSLRREASVDLYLNLKPKLKTVTQIILHNIKPDT